MLFEDESFKRLRRYAGYERYEDAAEFCGVSVSTIKNWDRHGPPLAVLKLFKLLNQDLSAYAPQWYGFQFVGGYLVDHNGKAFGCPDQIRGWRYLEDLIKLYEKTIIPELKNEITQLKDQLAALSQQKSATQRHTPWNRSRIGITTRIILPPEVKR